MTLDISSNRQAQKWSLRELAGRLFWDMAAPLFRFSPRLCWGWRVAMLRIFGAKIGSNVQIHPTAQIFIPWNLEVGDWTSIGFDARIYNLGMISVGEKTTISQCAHLCAGTHDYRNPTMPLLKRPITIGDEVWICADAFVGPGVTIGDGAVIGARAVVMKNIASGDIMSGNPARRIGQRPSSQGGA